jgi:pullulanase/glycogen debranching enzyme
MDARWNGGWVVGRLGRFARLGAASLLVAFGLAACGGSDPAASDTSAEAANTRQAQTVLNGIPGSQRESGAAKAITTTLRIHYRRTASDYAGWQVHSWGSAQDPGWNLGWNASGSDDFGNVYDIPLVANSGAVGYLFHNGDTKDDGGADQSWTLVPGTANEIWRIQNDLVTYTSNPIVAGPPDIAQLRVHYQRYAGDYAAWGLHLWGGSGLDTGRMTGVSYGDWNNPTPFTAMPNYAAGTGEVVFDIPVLNPKTNAGQTSLEFIIHGMAPNQNDKDGRPNNIHVDYASLTLANQTGEIWLVGGDATVYTSKPDLRSVSSTDARAVWLTKQLVQWPRVGAGLPVKLYYSNSGSIAVQKDAPVTGADGALVLAPYGGSVPTAIATRFKWVGAGGVFSVADADLPQLGRLHTKQVVLVQEDANGNVQNATTAQLAGAMDDLFAAAADEPNLGATVANGQTTFKLWAPTAQNVTLFLYPNAKDAASKIQPMFRDAATGIWHVVVAGDLTGSYYRFGVRVFARGTGLVRNVVTDPYSLSLSGNSARSFVVDMNSPQFKPADWDASQPPAKVAASPDMSIYELHVRDFSANDPTVPDAHRGKYLAFTDMSSNGMRHLRALAKAGLTDVHLMPVFDLSSIDEKGCTTPSPSGAPDSDSQQAAVAATASADCFNWGYDPFHYTTPEGSYATSVASGGTRVAEFRHMVQALNQAGLRVGMDVVYNHTTASGENDHSVLDQVVPGYYHRLDANGNVLHDSCCEDTASENLMMGKLVTDSVISWARDYHVSSFRFDIMGMMPKDLLVSLQAKVNAAVGRPVQLIGEGWNFGAVASGARFTQAAMYDLQGTGIGTFNPFIRDAVRGGGCCDSGSALIANQGYVNGLFYDPNAQGGGHTKGDLAWLGDILKASLAGSIRSYSLTTSWDATLTLDQLYVGGQPAGYVVDPSEAVNYVENHDNMTLFDTDVFKLPQATSAADRARVQMLGAAIDTFSQGVAYFHAGVDTLRSKSLDRNSYDSGDWFNRLDWSYADNNFGAGLPPQGSNGGDWDVMRPMLTNANNKPAAADIAWTRDEFRDLLKIRYSSSLLHMHGASDITSRLTFWNTGSSQEATVLVGDLNGVGYPGAKFKELMYLINVDVQPHTIAIPQRANRAFVLHPVQAAADAADARAKDASYDAATGSFSVPARTAVVFVVK